MNFTSKLKQDLRLAVRDLARRPAFTLAALATLALGIGANSAIFSVVRAVLLRPLPYHDAGQLVMVWRTVPARGLNQGFVSYLDYRDWKEQSESFEDLSAFWAWANGNVNLTGGSEPERVPVARVMAGYFEMLGARPLLGRTIIPSENRVGNHRVAMLSYGLWQRRFGGDTTLVGKPVYVNGFPYTVVGIMGPEFRPVGTLALGDDVELWRPLAPDDNQTSGRGGGNLRVIGRLAAGTSVARAQAELDGIARRLAEEYPETNAGTGVRVVPLREQVVQEVRAALMLLLGAVALVLLIACTNVANLLLVRAAERKKLIAVRVALGAPRWRIVQQLLTESVLLGALGGFLGLGLAVLGVNMLVAIGPGDIPLLGDVTVDGGVLLFTISISIAAGLLFGLVPALQFSKPHLVEALREGGWRSGGMVDRRVADVLVVSQVAFALMLLVAAGLLTRSFRLLTNVDPGFDPDNVLTLQIELPMATTYPTQEQRDIFFRELLDRIETVPGIESSSMTNAPPMGEGGFNISFTILGSGTATTSEDPEADLQVIESSYFETMGIPLLAGRSFSGTDTRNAPRVAIVSQRLAQAHWPDESPIGARLRLSFGFEAEIIGVVGNVHLNGLDTDIDPTIYWPADQMGFNFMTVIARTSSEPRQVLRLIQEEIKAMDADLPVYNVRTLAELISGSVAQRRFQMTLIGVFSLLAVSLAVVGIYGVVSYSVSQRTNEIGIRMALGARPEDTLRIVLLQGTRLAGIGIALGLVGSLALNRLLENFVFGVTTVDPVTSVVTSTVLGLAALAATYLPARRAGRVDPMIALRAE